MLQRELDRRERKATLFDRAYPIELGTSDLMAKRRSEWEIREAQGTDDALIPTHGPIPAVNWSVPLVQTAGPTGPTQITVEFRDFRTSAVEHGRDVQRPRREGRHAR